MRRQLIIPTARDLGVALAWALNGEREVHGVARWLFESVIIENLRLSRVNIDFREVERTARSELAKLRTPKPVVVGRTAKSQEELDNRRREHQERQRAAAEADQGLAVFDYTGGRSEPVRVAHNAKSREMKTSAPTKRPAPMVVVDFTRDMKRSARPRKIK